LQWLQIMPVFCDIDPQTHNLDPACVEALITGRTSGILGVHVWGRPCAVEALSRIARRHKLKLLFDAAHAFACSHAGQRIGNFGNAEVFSFHATKFFNTFEGGAVATNDDELAARVRLMRNFGFSGYDNVISLGVNGKMNELSAAMGLSGLECLDSFISTNRENYEIYKTLLQPLPGLKLVTYDQSESCNFQYIVVEIDQRQAGVSRDRLAAILHAENVLARRYFYPGCHRVEPYRSRAREQQGRLENTERLAENVLSLPNGTNVTRREIHTICNIIECAIKHSPGL
jgi:dTDP-4-amino-4,6-dideoxygalactose transaminase